MRCAMDSSYFEISLRPGSGSLFGRKKADPSHLASKGQNGKLSQNPHRIRPGFLSPSCTYDSRLAEALGFTENHSTKIDRKTFRRMLPMVRG
ncbi:spore coat protein S, putative [Anopheles sinensis]|uniref:Spore coat protein S, putative n=1 Tax=Anopheles sinensis TaxID=74873 RepID=A0A084WDE8_ANOSI|nr:spore coat protein S, putative [Anopheles sinensis]